MSTISPAALRKTAAFVEAINELEARFGNVTIDPGNAELLVSHEDRVYRLERDDHGLHGLVIEP